MRARLSCVEVHRSLGDFDGKNSRQMQILYEYLMQKQTARGDYCGSFGPNALPGSTLSRCAWNFFFESSGNPVNSIPIPTPGSRVRTTALGVSRSSPIHRSTRKAVPTVNGITVST